MKKRIISLVLLGISVLTVTACAVLQAQSQRMAEKIIRLHVVANSDSNVDQAVKLCVRDAVLREAQRALSSAADAKQAILTDLPALEAAANAELQRQGSGDTARVSFHRELFPTRDYDTFSLPSGVYQSLRVTIGKGEGHNWWCVVFPSICLTASMDEPPPPPDASRCSSNELQISAAKRITCSTAETIIARLSLSFCSVAFDTIGSQKLRR